MIGDRPAPEPGIRGLYHTLTLHRGCIVGPKDWLRRCFGHSGPSFVAGAGSVPYAVCRVPSFTPSPPSVDRDRRLSRYSETPGIAATISMSARRASQAIRPLTRCPCGSAAQRRNEHTVVPGRAVPSHTLPQAGGMGKPDFPIPLRAGQAGSKRRAADAPSPHPPACGPGPPAGGSVGKPGFPTPRSESLCSRQGTFQRLLLRCKRRRETRQRHTCLLACLASLEGTLSYHTCARAQAEAGPGRAAPSQTLPRVGAWGNPVSPYPCGAGAWGNPVSPHPSLREPMFTLALHAAPPHPDGMNIGYSWEGYALPNPPAGGGVGKPGFPTLFPPRAYVHVRSQPCVTNLLRPGHPKSKARKHDLARVGCGRTKV